MKDDKYLPDFVDFSEINDADLRQCEYCGYITHKDEIPTGRDPFSGEAGLAYCPECNEGEPFKKYEPKK